MRKIIVVAVLCLWLLPASSRAVDLFHISADEQLAKFEDLFKSLVSEDNQSLSKMIAGFVLSNDPDGTDQVALYEHDTFIDFLDAPSRNYDHIAVTLNKRSLTLKTLFREGKSLPPDSDGQKGAHYKPYIVADSEIVYECHMRQKNSGHRQNARMKVSMQNVYTDDYPDGIITCLYFTDIDEGAGIITPVSDWR